MMKLLSPKFLSAAAVACIGALSAPAFAQAVFTPGTGTTANCNPTGTTFDSVQCTASSVTVTMQAWGFTGATLSGTTANAGFQRGRIGDFSTNGFGAYTGTNESGTDSQHAFDNVTTGCGTGSGASGGTVPLSTANSGCGGSIEALFLDFGTSRVNLTSVNLGYSLTDADYSVWVWTGTGGPSMTTQTALGSSTVAASMAGWSLVKSIDGDMNNPGTTGGTLYSSYFMITTYFGAAATNLDAGNDRFKISQFTAATCTGTLGTGVGSAQTCTTTRVPEPASLALVGVALLGMTASRRRLFGRR